MPSSARLLQALPMGCACKQRILCGLKGRRSPARGGNPGTRSHRPDGCTLKGCWRGSPAALQAARMRVCCRTPGFTRGWAPAAFQAADDRLASCAQCKRDGALTVSIGRSVRKAAVRISAGRRRLLRPGTPPFEPDRPATTGSSAQLASTGRIPAAGSVAQNRIFRDPGSFRRRRNRGRRAWPDRATRRPAGSTPGGTRHRSPGSRPPPG